MYHVVFNRVIVESRKGACRLNAPRSLDCTTHIFMCLQWVKARLASRGVRRCTIFRLLPAIQNCDFPKLAMVPAVSHFGEQVQFIRSGKSS